VEALQALVLARRGEVDCLLRIEMANAADVDKARDRVQEALAFDDELCELAASRGVIKGKLFQALLEELRATGASHAQLDNSCKKFGGFGVAKEFKLNLAEWASLTMKADALRNLVRIKVADDNDLQTARSGLVLCYEFFLGLGQLTELRGPQADEYELLRELDGMTC